MKKLFVLLTFCLISFLGYSQDEIERIFLYKSNGEYFVRVEIPYFTDLASPENKIIIDVPGKHIRQVVSLMDIKKHQSQNEFTDYVAVYNFKIGKNSLFRMKKLKCRVRFDYKGMDESFTLEFRKFMWL